MPSLVFLAGPIAGRRYKLGDGAYLIGRRSDCQIFVPDMRVSRQHARLWHDGGGWSLEDLGSNNGTYINGVRVQRATTVRPDDEIAIASNRIRVEAREPTPAPRFPGGDAVTIVEVGAMPLYRSREDTDSGGGLLVSTGLVSATDQRAVRLLERKLDALTQVLHATASSGSVGALLDGLSDALLALFPQAIDVGVLVEDDRTGELRVQCQRHREAPPAAGDGARTGALRVPDTIIRHVITDRRGVLLGERADGSDHEAPALGIRMGAPLDYHGAHYGLVYVESHTRGFRQEDVDLLQAIATQAGLAMHATRIGEELARRERLERDLLVARQIQRSLLPASVPHIAGLEVAVHYEPAYEIGGDFYDFIWHDPTHLGIAVGDVAGKAISAALYMARLTSELRSRAALARTPARLLRRVNQAIAGLGDDGMFATLVYCIYDLEARTLVFTNAGHCVPLLRRDEHVFPLQADRAHTPPLGVTPDLEAGEARVQLLPGDLLLMVSDGILEARDAQGEEYGLARLSRRLCTSTGSPADVIQAILADIEQHAGELAQGDDMTIVALRIAEGIAERRATRRTGVDRLETEDGEPPHPPGDESAAPGEEFTSSDTEPIPQESLDNATSSAGSFAPGASP